jgi:16S rRNA C967 or C1407 C5-methylase (RsmB/RsmF family)
MCAAPGGKTSHVASLLRNQGSIIAVDKSKGKVDKMGKFFKQCGITCVQTVAKDSSRLDYPVSSFDRIILDPPCSGIGITFSFFY